MSRRLSLFTKVALTAVLAGVTGTGVYAVYANVVDNSVDIPDFVGKDVRIADIYAKRGGYEDQIVYTYEYSEEYKENIVIEQSTKKLESDTDLVLVVSKGYDAEKVFELPDFSNQLKEEIETWFENYHFENVTFTYTAVEDENIAEDTFVSSDPAAGTEVLRMDEITVTLATHDITLPDLLGMSKSDIDEWAATWGITISYVTQESNFYADDDILSVSLVENEIVHRGDTITVTVAKHTDTPTQEVTSEEIYHRDTDTNSSGETRDNGYVETPADPTTEVVTPSEPETTVEPEPTVQPDACMPSIIYSIYQGQDVSYIQGSLSSGGCIVNIYYVDNPDNVKGVSNYISYGNYADVYVFAVE